LFKYCEMNLARSLLCYCTCWNKAYTSIRYHLYCITFLSNTYFMCRSLCFD